MSQGAVASRTKQVMHARYDRTTLKMRSHFWRLRLSAGSRRPARDRIILFYSKRL